MHKAWMQVVEAANLCENPSLLNQDQNTVNSHKVKIVMEITKKFTMAATHLTYNLLMALIVSAAALGAPQLNEDVVTMVQEMQHANYFTFVMLINMMQDRIPPNATFLMPSDRVLSKTPVPENKVLEFLLRHSIPSPLLFDDMRHFPNETMVPTYQPDYMLRIINRGRKRFYLNNVQITSINICTAGSFFRCHGINDVLDLAADNRTVSPCPKANPPTVAPEPPSSPSKSPPPSESSDGVMRSIAPDGLSRLLLSTIGVLSCKVLSTKFSI